MRFSGASDLRNTVQQYNKDYRGTQGDGGAYNQRYNEDFRNKGSTSNANTTAETKEGKLAKLFDCSLGRPLQIVTADAKSGKFSLNLETFDVLKRVCFNI